MNISSTASLRDAPKGTAYYASTFALGGMSECWRAELRRYNIRVFLINLSEVTAGFSATAGLTEKDNETKLHAEDIAGIVKAALETDDRGFCPELSIFATNPKDRLLDMIHTGRHFLQIPGPTNVPHRVLRAMAQPVIDHRSSEFSRLATEVLEGLRPIFQTSGSVLMYPSSGTGAWEAAIVNTLSAGDRVLMFETGHFSQLWRQVAEAFGLQVEYVPGNWRRGVVLADMEARLGADEDYNFKAVLVVHNETSTGVTSRIPEIRSAMNRLGHPGLLIVDAISSLASMDFRHDEWGVDVAICGSQKGLMLPPGLSFLAVSERALAANKSAKLPRAYWDWQQMLRPNRAGFFPYTPPTNLLYGLREALQMLREEGLTNVFRRHQRHAEATRSAVRAWGLEIVCEEPLEFSSTTTAVLMPEGHDADRLRAIILDNFDMSLGAGLSKLAGKVFRIGHLGSFNDLMLAGTLSGVEMGLRLAGVPYKQGGVMAALDSLAPSDKVAGSASSPR